MKKTTLVILLVFVVLIGIRLINLEADPPAYADGFKTRYGVPAGDEGYKAYVNRNLALFSKTTGIDGDDTDLWYTPANMILSVSYQLFGVGLWQTRIVSVLFFAFGLIVFYNITKEEDFKFRLVAVLLLGLNFALFSYSRMFMLDGIIVSMQIFLLASTFWFLKAKTSFGKVGSALMIISWFILILATKSHGLIIIPCILFGLWLYNHSSIPEDEHKEIKNLILLYIVLIVLGLALMVMSPGHFSTSSNQAGEAIGMIRFAPIYLYETLQYFMPLTTLLVLLALPILISERSFKVVIFSCIILAGTILNFMFQYKELRYHLWIIPAFCFLAAYAIFCLKEVHLSSKWSLYYTVLAGLIGLAIAATFIPKYHTFVPEQHFRIPFLAIQVVAVALCMFISSYLKKGEVNLKIKQNVLPRVILATILLAICVIPVTITVSTPVYGVAQIAQTLDSLNLPDTDYVGGDFSLTPCLETRLHCIPTKVECTGIGRNEWIFNTSQKPKVLIETDSYCRENLDYVPIQFFEVSGKNVTIYTLNGG